MRTMPEEHICPDSPDHFTWNLANGTDDAKPLPEPNPFPVCNNFSRATSVMPSYVLGVVLVDERITARRLQNIMSAAECLALGVILLDNVNINAEELRRLMCSQVPALPASFAFLTKQGWPIKKLQEHTIQAHHIITEKNSILVMKQYDGLRVGIRSTAGECVGFVFLHINWSICQVRDAINDQLKEVRRNKAEYRFLEKTDWPVALHQEGVLSAVDVIRCGNHICIEYTSKHLPVSLQEPNVTAQAKPPLVLPTPTAGPNQPNDKTDGSSTWAEIRRGSWRLRPFESVRRKAEDWRRHGVKGDLVAKPILISYARAEASQHALLLKSELESIGFSVFLDVHEIKTGSDWQDALNYAVRHCQFFVPLITPMYGKTQWTNREKKTTWEMGKWNSKACWSDMEETGSRHTVVEETWGDFHPAVENFYKDLKVKLADVLQKTIIPINFLDQWPPECLAIQFASIHYIPWKPQEGDHARVDLEHSRPDDDSEIWSTVHIKRVCKEIAAKCKVASKKNEESDTVPPLLDKKERKETEKRRFKISYHATEDANRSVVFCKMLKENVDRNLIVISAHPKQRVLVHQLQVTLENEGCSVWCSPDILDPLDNFTEDSFPSNPNTPRELPSIPEGNTVLAQAYSEIANSIADSKRGSLMKADVDSSFEKRQLNRMISQVSDISQVSSLSPDKLDRLKTFQQKTDQAGVVIIVVSESYTKSKTSQQQVFYCEHRKQVILIRFDQSTLPSWFTMLMGSDMISNVGSPQFMTTLKARVKRALNPSSSETPKDAAAEAKMQFLVNFMKKNLPLPETCVYIAGSSKLQNYRSEEIARALGRELAKVQNITLCTGGFYGAPEITARSFFDCVENNRDPGTSPTDPLVHLLPFKDAKDFSSKAHQNTDGSFEALTFGKTVFLGDSVKERETAVARLFDTCIVIEGGPGAAHEVEEFIWNDHFVIPIISTGGAAGGQYGVPVKIFDAPPCVSKNDWLLLSEKEAKPEDVAKAVVNIVVAIKQSIATHNSSRMSQQNTVTRTRTRNRSRKAKAASVPRDPSRMLRDGVGQTQGPENPNINGHRLLQRQSVSYSDFEVKRNYSSKSKWQKFLRIFSATKIS